MTTQEESAVGTPSSFTVSFPRRRESSMLDAAGLAVMDRQHQRMLDSRLRGNDGGEFAVITICPW
jgi:hypothetical protein